MNSLDLNNGEKEFYGVGSFIFEIIKVVVLAFLIIVPIRVFLFQPFFVQGASMEPTFENNEYLIVNEFGYKKTPVNIGSENIFTVSPFKNLERKDVIVFRYPKNRSQFFIKRIIGLPGEKIELKEGRITVYNNDFSEGFVLDESDYLDESVKTLGSVSMVLKEDEYFVMGDNRMFSSDSRSWGPIKKSDVIGKILLRAWPLTRIDFFDF